MDKDELSFEVVQQEGYYLTSFIKQLCYKPIQWYIGAQIELKCGYLYTIEGSVYRRLILKDTRK